MWQTQLQTIPNMTMGSINPQLVCWWLGFPHDPYIPTFFQFYKIHLFAIKRSRVSCQNILNSILVINCHFFANKTTTGNTTTLPILAAKNTSPKFPQKASPPKQSHQHSKSPAKNASKKQQHMVYTTYLWWWLGDDLWDCSTSMNGGYTIET